MIDAAEVRRRLHYDASTGIFTWLVYPRRLSNKIPGQRAGCVVRGYIDIGLDGQQYGAHRLAWLYVHGVWPTHDIDHINGIRDDNRIENLRDVPRAKNIQNQRRPHKGNQSGYLGVRPCGRRWQSKIQTHGVVLHLGYFDTPQQAHEAYVMAKRKLHEGCSI